MSKRRKILSGLAGLMAVLVVIAAVYLWTPSGPKIDTSDIRARAAQYDVEIIRDNFGVPHIKGVTDADASFGLAYAQSEDDWKHVQQALVETRGMAAQVYGKASAPMDYLNDVFKVYSSVEAKFETELSPEIRALAQGYADGVNFYALNNPHGVAKGLLPVTAKDVVAGFTFGTPFFYRMDEDLKALFSADEKPNVSPWARDAKADLRPPHPFATNLPEAVRGSNAFAVAPSRSDDGHTRLIINSHQPMTGRYAWYEAHMISDEGMNIAGANFPGVPYMAQGVTPFHGWGQTVNKPDLVDIYALTVDDEDDPQRYKLDGEWKAFERSESRFRVKLFGPFSLPIKRDVLWSDHGPVLPTESGFYALRFAGMGEVRQIEQWHAMGKARSFEDWKAALNMGALLSFNIIYADRDGHIGALYNARMPKRIDGPKWHEILPGDRSDLIWTETLPVSALPQKFDPESGWLFSANHDPFFMTEASSAPKRSDFSDTFGIPTRMTNRGLRGLELLSPDASITREDLLSYRADTQYSARSTLRKLVNTLIAAEFDEPVLQEARDVLAAWGGDTNFDDRGAALAVMTGVTALGSQYIETLMDPVDALRLSAERLQATHGRMDPKWGEVNRLTRGQVDVPVDGAPDVLRAIYGDPNDVADDGKMSALAGDTHIMIADWAPDGTLDLRTINQYGAATSRPDSPHYADQASLFARGRYKSMPLSWEAVEATAEERYRPGSR